MNKSNTSKEILKNLNYLILQKNRIESEYTKQNSISLIHFELQQLKLEHINKKIVECNIELQKILDNV
jgi:hypothetical protein